MNIWLRLYQQAHNPKKFAIQYSTYIITMKLLENSGRNGKSESWTEFHQRYHSSCYRFSAGNHKIQERYRRKSMSFQECSRSCGLLSYAIDSILDQPSQRRGSIGQAWSLWIRESRKWLTNYVVWRWKSSSAKLNFTIMKLPILSQTTRMISFSTRSPSHMINDKGRRES